MRFLNHTADDFRLEVLVVALPLTINAVRGPGSRISLLTILTTEAVLGANWNAFITIQLKLAQ